jgi:hypothetical protein
MAARGFAGPGAHAVHPARGPRVGGVETAAAVGLGVAALVRAALSSPVA